MEKFKKYIRRAQTGLLCSKGLTGCSEQLYYYYFLAKLIFGLGFKNGNNIYSLVFSKLKPKVPMEIMCSGLVYKIPCKDCDLCYIGHTASYLKVRLSKHKPDVRLKKVEVCATAYHAVENRQQLSVLISVINFFTICSIFTNLLLNSCYCS